MQIYAFTRNVPALFVSKGNQNSPERPEYSKIAVRLFHLFVEHLFKRCPFLRAEWIIVELPFANVVPGMEYTPGIQEHPFPLIFCKFLIDSQLFFRLFSFYLLVCFQFVFSLWTMFFVSLTWIYFTGVSFSVLEDEPIKRGPWVWEM